MKRFSLYIAVAALLAAGAVGFSPGAASAAQGSAPVSAATGSAAVFAVVNGTAITVAELDNAYAQELRRKFYHRAPPEGEAAAVRREVGDRLIERALLLAEGGRRGIKPDAGQVSAKLAGYDKRYANSPQWRTEREILLPRLRREFERQSLLAQLEQTVRAVPEPGDKELRTYYAAHPELFTEPERMRLSLILLKVDPSSAKIVWDKAREEAQAIIKRLAAGADFAQLARLHSGDSSAEKGGDIGYVHRGILPEAVHQVVGRLKPGIVSDPVVVLEGVAVLRLEDRTRSRLMEFAQVRQRVAALRAREQADRQWKEFSERLRSAASVKIVSASRYPTAGARAEKAPPVR